MKGWDSNVNKQNRGNQHYRTSELLLRIQILFYFLLLLLFLSFMFSLSSFSEAQSRNINKFQHNGIYLYKMKNTCFKLVVKFQIMVASDYGFYFYGASLWY
jgi:hypothetical protein